MKFRKAIQDDIPELIELRIKQLIDEGYPETIDIRTELHGYFTASINSSSLICLLGIKESLVVATGGLCFYQLPPTFSNPTGKIAYITNMYTDESYRRKGIASIILSNLLDEAKALNYTVVKLHASMHGKSVYEQSGFVDADGYMTLKF